MSVNVSSFVRPVVTQRRFRYLLTGLVALSLLLGIVVVPIEHHSNDTQIHTWFDGLWWSVVTVTGVGYGDVVPVTNVGRAIGMTLSVIGVLAFGLIISMFSMALENTKERYFQRKLFEKLDAMEQRLDKMERRDHYLIKQNHPD